MRTSAAKIKGTGNSVGAPLHERPDASQPLGKLYDYFMQHPLQKCTVKELQTAMSCKGVRARVEALRNFYGMTIEHIRPCTYRLIATDERDFIAEGVERMPDL